MGPLFATRGDLKTPKSGLSEESVMSCLITNYRLTFRLSETGKRDIMPIEMVKDAGPNPNRAAKKHRRKPSDNNLHLLFRLFVISSPFVYSCPIYSSQAWYDRTIDRDDDTAPPPSLPKKTLTPSDESSPALFTLLLTKDRSEADPLTNSLTVSELPPRRKKGGVGIP